jgi:hypothetical protein
MGKDVANLLHATPQETNAGGSTQYGSFGQVPRIAGNVNRRFRLLWMESRIAGTRFDATIDATFCAPIRRLGRIPHERCVKVHKGDVLAERFVAAPSQDFVEPSALVLAQSLVGKPVQETVQLVAGVSLCPHVRPPCAASAESLRSTQCKRAVRIRESDW